MKVYQLSIGAYQIIPKLNGLQQQKFAISQFLWSGIQAWLRWVLSPQGFSHEVTVKLSVKGKSQAANNLWNASIYVLKNRVYEGFPGGTVVKNPPASAGDTGSSPSLGRFPHAAEQLSPCTTTTDPVLQRP